MDQCKPLREPGLKQADVETRWSVKERKDDFGAGTIQNTTRTSNSSGPNADPSSPPLLEEDEDQQQMRSADEAL